MVSAEGGEEGENKEGNSRAYLGEEEKERRRDATSLGNKWPCPKSRGLDSKSCAYANNADENVMLTKQLK
jgi:hypothetical protein